VVAQPEGLDLQALPAPPPDQEEERRETMKRIVLGEGLLSLTWKFGEVDPAHSLVGLWDDGKSATRKSLAVAMPLYAGGKRVRLIVEEVSPRRQPRKKARRKA
jgi:hypothetical protein